MVGHIEGHEDKEELRFPRRRIEKMTPATAFRTELTENSKEQFYVVDDY